MADSSEQFARRVSPGRPGSCGAGQMQETTAVCDSGLRRDSGKRVVPGSTRASDTGTVKVREWELDP